MKNSKQVKPAAANADWSKLTKNLNTQAILEFEPNFDHLRTPQIALTAEEKLRLEAILFPKFRKYFSFRTVKSLIYPKSEQKELENSAYLWFRYFLEKFDVSYYQGHIARKKNIEGPRGKKTIEWYLKIHLIDSLRAAIRDYHFRLETVMFSNPTIELRRNKRLENNVEVIKPAVRDLYEMFIKEVQKLSPQVQEYFYYKFAEGLKENELKKCFKNYRELNTEYNSFVQNFIVTNSVEAADSFGTKPEKYAELLRKRSRGTDESMIVKKLLSDIKTHEDAKELVKTTNVNVRTPLTSVKEFQVRVKTKSKPIQIKKMQLPKEYANSLQVLDLSQKTVQNKYQQLKYPPVIFVADMPQPFREVKESTVAVTQNNSWNLRSIFSAGKAIKEKMTKLFTSFWKSAS